jgi:hypothetical protein
VEVPLVVKSFCSVYSPGIPSSPQVVMLPGVSMEALVVCGKKKEKKEIIPSNKILFCFNILLIDK